MGANNRKQFKEVLMRMNLGKVLLMKAMIKHSGISVPKWKEKIVDEVIATYETD